MKRKAVMVLLAALVASSVIGCSKPEDDIKIEVAKDDTSEADADTVTQEFDF